MDEAKVINIFSRHDRENAPRLLFSIELPCSAKVIELASYEPDYLVRLATPATEAMELTVVLEIKGMLTEEDKAKARSRPAGGSPR